MTARDENDRTRRFLELLASNERRIAQFVFAMVPNWADADDLTQQTKMRLWEQFDEYDADKDFGAWACTIARYLVLTHRKASQRRHSRLSQAYLDAMAEEVSALSRREDRRHLALESCLQLLSDASRRLIGMCYSGNRTIKEVAETLGRSAAATRQAVLRIRRQLQKCVEAKEAEV